MSVSAIISAKNDRITRRKRKFLISEDDVSTKTSVSRESMEISCLAITSLNGSINCGSF